MKPTETIRIQKLRTESIWLSEYEGLLPIKTGTRTPYPQLAGRSHAPALVHLEKATPLALFE